MKKTNISIFLNYKKSKNIFLLWKRFINFSLLKKKLKKEYCIRIFKNSYQVFYASNQEISHYFGFNENMVTLVLGDEKTVNENVKLILELKRITNPVLVLSGKIQTINIDKLSDNLQTPIVGINKNNIINLKEILKNSKKEKGAIQNVVYPKLVEEQFIKIEELFPETLEKKRKHFLALQLLSKNFSLIDSILNIYHVNPYTYFRLKQELMEYGYAPDYLKQIYLTFYEEQYRKIVK